MRKKVGLWGKIFLPYLGATKEADNYAANALFGGPNIFFGGSNIVLCEAKVAPIFL